MKNLTPSKTRSTNRKAAVSVEFALIAPIIFMIFTGCLELTAMNLIRQTAGNAAYETARAAIVPGADHDDARAIGEYLLTSVGATENVDIDITDNGQTVVVEVIVPVSDNSWGLGKFTGDLTIRKGCSLAREL